VVHPNPLVVISHARCTGITQDIIENPVAVVQGIGATEEDSTGEEMEVVEAAMEGEGEDNSEQIVLLQGL
jgi:hypothetical protein